MLAQPAIPMAVQPLLRRIGFAGGVTPSVETLAALQRAFVLCVPFENLDIGLGRAIRLDLTPMYDKVVTQRRGGLCYELNGLFHWLLQELGFAARMVSGRTFVQGKLGEQFEHLAVLVELDEWWLADVGFGGFSRAPLRLAEREAQSDGFDCFRILEEDGEFVAAVRLDEGSWLPRYRFGVQPRRLAEFAARCEYHQSAPGSLFRAQDLCYLALERGRKSLAGTRLTVSMDGGTETVELNPAERITALREHFGLVLPVGADD